MNNVKCIPGESDRITLSLYSPSTQLKGEYSGEKSKPLKNPQQPHDLFTTVHLISIVFRNFYTFKYDSNLGIGEK